MHQLWAWSTANPAYALGTLVGFAVGVFYGLDGWRGSVEDLDLKDSPRMKNLVWVLGGAVVSFFGDIKAIDATAQKPLLLLYYFAAVLAGAILVVVPWAVIVFLQSVFGKDSRAIGYGIGDAISDYFYYGYRYYRRRKDDLKDANREKLQRYYLEQITYSITVAGSQISEEQRLNAATNILRLMVAVVQDYRRGNPSSSKIRANLMLVRDCTPENRGELHFAEDPGAVKQFLELVVYENTERGKFFLPLPPGSDSEAALPGAPFAFLSEAPVIVDDTSKIEIANKVPEKVRQNIDSYFSSKQRSFKSFASLRVIGAGSPIGVVNVESADPFVFGETEDDKRRMSEYLLPFCSVFGILFSRGGRRGDSA